MSVCKWVLTTLVPLALSLLAGPALADGFILPTPLPDVPRPPHLAVKYHRVDVQIRAGVAVTTIDQVFQNDFGRDLEGTYIFPLPEDAAVTDFTMWVDGKPLSGKVLSKEEARRIYEGYVRRKVDPAILEYVGREMFQARVFPIPARGEKRIQLKYSQVVPFDGGTYAYRYPLNTERFSSRPLREVAVNVSIESPKPLRAIYSPTHEVDVRRSGETRASVSYEGKDIRPSKDFHLYFAVSEKEFGLNLLTFSPNGGRSREGGFFLLMLAPRTELRESRAIPKDVTFVVDTSGSMSGEKMEQAKKALLFALNNLNRGDRFAILTFSGEVARHRPGLTAATPEALADARKFVEEMQARGGTNINDALVDALKLQNPRQGSPAMVVFLTDGLPTVGTTEVPEILKNVRQARQKDIRVFVFGVGDDVNTHLLDRVSGENGGVSEYVRPGEDLEVKVSSFTTKIATPVLTNLELDFGGVEVFDLYPRRLPDLFAGSQLILLGRYRNTARTQIVLKGSVSGEGRRFTYPADFAGEDAGAGFIPRLWATRKVGYLLDELRLNGHNKELVDEVIRLGTEYGIITPYTASLVEEDARLGRRETADAMEQMAAAMPSAAPGAPTAKASGASAVNTARRVREGKEAERVQDESESVRHVEGKTFALRHGIWTDTTYRPEMKRREVRFASDEYFALIAKEPVLAKYFALGERVLVVRQGEAIVVVPAP